jgi:putative hydrolase of the HAD superfamily
MPVRAKLRPTQWSESMTAISTVLFDLDGTLYDRDSLVRSLAMHQYRYFKREFRHVSCGRFVRRLVELDDHGYRPKREVYAAVGQEFSLSASLQERLITHFWAAYDEHCLLPEDTLETLRALRSGGKKLGIVTNGTTARQHAKIDTLGIRSFFDVIVVSEREGFRKPDKQIFLRALDQCSAAPADALFVGDHPEIDIAGALNAGLRAAWKSVPYWRMCIAGVPKIDSLSELLNLVDG